MARPIRNNAVYFTHEANLRNDRRIKAIRTQCGAAGYGMLHMLLEALTDADFTQLSTDEEELELLAGDFGVSVTEIHSLLQIGEKVKFFARNEAGLLICPDLNTWLSSVFEKRNRARNAAKPDKPGITVTETPVPVTVIPQSKVKESKELLNSNSESKLPPAPREGEAGSQKKIGAENFTVNAQASAPTAPPVAATPHSSPSSWPPADPGHPFPGVVLPFASEAFAELWGRWRQVATERGCGYRGAMSEQESLKRLTEFSGVGPENEALAVKIIKQTLGSPTWKNFYAIKPEIDVRQQSTTIRTNRLAGPDSSQRTKVGNPSFAGDVA